jgi:hypothetical protein
LRNDFVGSTCTHPFIDLGQLKFPKPPDLVRGQSFAFAPAVNGVLHDAQMSGDIDCGNPRFGVHGIGAQFVSSKSFKIVFSLTGSGFGGHPFQRWKLGFLIEKHVHGGVVNHFHGASDEHQASSLDAYLACTAAVHTILERLQQVAVNRLSTTTTTPMPLTGAKSAILSGRMPG